MDVIWLRNEKKPVVLGEHEIEGPPHQSTFIDPLSNSGIVHEGITVEEWVRDGYAGIYVPLDKFRLTCRNYRA